MAHEAVPLLERIVAETPRSLPALEALAADSRAAGAGRRMRAIAQKVYSLGSAIRGRVARVADSRCAPGRHRRHRSFRESSAPKGTEFRTTSSLGSCTWPRGGWRARAALDRVPATNPSTPMALFKRAQVKRAAA